MQDLQLRTPATRRSPLARRSTFSVYRETLSAVAALVETRDPDGHDHLARIRAYCRHITDGLDARPRIGRPMAAGFAELVVEASTLHDIGKATVPDRILLKPGPLTRREISQMRGHAEAGFRILSRITRRIGSHPFLRVACDITRYHHERWDGNGYPNGLSGHRVPLAARIVAVADVFDALVSRRCYKPAIPVDDAFEIIKGGSGAHFDPVVVAAFTSARKPIAAVAAGAG